MKKYLQILALLLVIAWGITPSSCLHKSVIKESIYTQYDVEKLRELYSSDASKWPAPEVDSIVLANGFQDIGHLPPTPYPDGNPHTEEKYTLGKMLFHDPRLSSSGQIACASCHDPQLGWGDGKRVAFGHDRQTGNRNAMTLFNVAFYDSLFWDGRALGLEHQATMPIENPIEMHAIFDTVVERIAQIKGYEPYFTKAYGDASVSRARIVNAIATFERKIVSPKSRFDHFIDGKKDILSDEEVVGLHLFRTKARCINCHNTGLFSDGNFHNDGQTLFGTKNEDLGLYLTTKNPEDAGKFKTPSLRETMNTGPWMHHGNFATIEDVLFFYDRGNPVPKAHRPNPADSLQPTKSPLLKELHLSQQEIFALKAFLQSITTPTRRMKAPNLPD